MSKYPDSEFIYLDEARFISELLEAIKNPEIATAYTDWPTVSRKKIPFKPFDTFRPRLVAELLFSENLLCHNASDIDNVTEIVAKRTAKRQHGREDLTRTVRRKVDMACGNEY